MIFLQDAYEAAQELLDSGLRQRVPDVIIASCAEFPTGWVFGYNTRRYLENNDFMAALLGGPIVVPKLGKSAYFGDASLPNEEQLAGE